MKRLQVTIQRTSIVTTTRILVVTATTLCILLYLSSSVRASNNKQDEDEATFNWRVRWTPSDTHEHEDSVKSDDENVKSEWNDKDVYKKEDDATQSSGHMKYFYPSVPRSQLAVLFAKENRSPFKSIQEKRKEDEEDEDEVESSSRDRYSSQFVSLKDNEQVEDVTVNPRVRDESIYDLHKESSRKGMFHWSTMRKEELIDRWIKTREQEQEKQEKTRQHQHEQRQQQQQQQQQKQSKLVTSFRVTSKKGSSEKEVNYDNTTNSRDEQFKVNQLDSSMVTRQVYNTNTWSTTDAPRTIQVTSQASSSLFRFTNWTEYAMDKLQKLPMGNISSSSTSRVQTFPDTSDIVKVPVSWKPVKKENKKSVNKLQRLDEEASASQYIASPPVNNLIVSAPVQSHQQQQTQQSIPFQSSIPVHFPPVLLPPSSIQLQSGQLGSIQSSSFLHQPSQPVVSAPSLPVSTPAEPVAGPSVAPVALPVTLTSQPVIQSPPLTPLPLFPVSQQQQPQQPTINLNSLKSPSSQSTPLAVNFIRQHSPPGNLVAVNEPRVDVVRLQSAPSIALNPATHIIQRTGTFHTHVHGVASPSLPTTIVHSPVHHVHPLPPPPPPPPPPATTVVHHPPAVVHTPPAVIHHPPEIVHRAPTVVHTPPALVPRAPTVIHTPRLLPIPAPLPIVHAAPIHHHHHHPIGVAHSPACISRVPLLTPSVPVFASPPTAIHLHSPVPLTRASTLVVPASPVRTRTVLTQVQYLPEQTHVVTTTQFNPARKTTIYETDHLPAYSSNRPVIALPPPPPPPASASPAVATNVIKVADSILQAPVREREHATIYTFPSLVKNRIVGAPIRLTDRIIARRKIRQKERLKQYEERQKVKKDKKIIFIDRKDSQNVVNGTFSSKVTSAPFNVHTVTAQ